MMYLKTYDSQNENFGYDIFRVLDCFLDADRKTEAEADLVVLPPELAGVKLNAAAIPVLGEDIERLFRRQLEQRLTPQIGDKKRLTDSANAKEDAGDDAKNGVAHSDDESIAPRRRKKKKRDKSTVFDDDNEREKKKTAGKKNRDGESLTSPSNNEKKKKKKAKRDRAELETKTRKKKKETDEEGELNKRKKRGKSGSTSSATVAGWEEPSSSTNAYSSSDASHRARTLQRPPPSRSLRHGDWRDHRWAGLAPSRQSQSTGRQRGGGRPPSVRWVLKDGRWSREWMSDASDGEDARLRDEEEKREDDFDDPVSCDSGSFTSARRDSRRYDGNGSSLHPNSRVHLYESSAGSHCNGGEWRRERRHEMETDQPRATTTREDGNRHRRGGTALDHEREGKMPEHLRWLHARWQRSNNEGGTAVGIVERKWREEQARRPQNRGRGSYRKSDHTGTTLDGLLANLRPTDPRLRPDMTRGSRRGRESNRGRRGGGWWPHGEGDRTGIDDERWPCGQSQTLPITQFRSAGAVDFKEKRLLSFKEFLLDSHRGDLNETAAVRAYESYKLDYRKRALADYFSQHKEEEWFLEKYHPILVDRRETARIEKVLQGGCVALIEVNKRLDAFMQLLVRGFMEVPLDWSSSRKLRKLLDAVVVLLEGGDDGDVACLKDYDYFIEEKLEERRLGKEKEVRLAGDDQSGDEDDDGESEDGKKQKIASRERRGGERVGKALGTAGRTKEEQEAAEAEGLLTEEMLERMQHARDYSLYVMEHEELIDMSDAPDNLGPNSSNPHRIARGVFVEQIAVPKALEEMNLHKTAALQLRNIPPVISRQELVEMCRNAHGGFLRLHLSEPKPFGNYFRHAIVSFWYNANVKKILWKLRGTHLAGVPLIVLEHKDAERRVCKADGLAADRAVALRDIHLCKNLIKFLDAKAHLWNETGEEEVNNEQVRDDGVAETEIWSKNPLLVNLDDCLAYHLHQLIEAGERDPSAPAKPQMQDCLINRDENLLRVLDRLILYLRIVHSVDFYGCVVHEDENDLPRRFRATTVRGTPERPGNPKRLAEYIKSFEARLRLLFPERRLLAAEHVQLLGRRSEADAVQQCIKENAVTVDGGLSQCMLCSKRFAALDFVHAHIEAVHGDRLEQAKWRALCFNAYLADPRRPFFVQNTVDDDCEPATMNTTTTVE